MSKELFVKLVNENINIATAYIEELVVKRCGKFFGAEYMRDIRMHKMELIDELSTFGVVEAMNTANKYEAEALVRAFEKFAL